MTEPKFQTRSRTMKSFTLTIDPDLATDFLSHNTHNRRLRQPMVDYLIGVIERDEWLCSGDAIRFDVNDRLIDGQHRLWAIVYAEKAVQSLVVTGLPPETQETIDLGGRRNLTDALRLRPEGYPNVSSLAATLHYWWRYANGHVRRSSVRPSIAQALALLDNQQGLLDAVKEGHKINRRFRMAPAVAAACWFEFESLDSDANYAFWDGVMNGVALEDGDPRLVLRNYYLAQMSANIGARAASLAHHAQTIKAWDAYRDGRKIERLYWRASGTNPEPFPEAY